MEPAARSQFHRGAKKRPHSSSTTSAQQINCCPPPGRIEAAAAGSTPARSSSAVRPAKKRAAAAPQIDVRIEAAAAGSAPRRTRRTVQIPALGIEAAAAVSASHIPRRRRTARIRIPSRRAKTVRPPHPVTDPVVSPVRGAHSSLPDLDSSSKRASNSDHPLQLRPCRHNYWRDLGDPARSSPQDLVVDHSDSDNKVLLRSLPPSNRADAKRARAPRDDDLVERARTDLPWRDWSGIGDGPAGLIADRVLAYDVADYVRFRAVCRPWRLSSTKPRTHSGLDRRFHPWRWTMLREELATPDRRSFLNTSTGQCVQVDIPELRDHELLALTPEGLLVLARKPPCTTTLCLLNPLTRHLIQLPPLSALVPSEYHEDFFFELDALSLETDYTAWGSGIANDDSTVVLCFHSFNMLGMAKPGDDHWTLLYYDGGAITATPIMFEGRFYCVNQSGVMVLEKTGGPPRLEVAAKLNMPFCTMMDSFHLFNNCGELMLVRCHLKPGKETAWFYDTYRVDLDTGTLLPVKSLGGAGRALFLGMFCSLVVSPEVFPSGSICADTIYLSFDMNERDLLKVGAYHLADGSVELPNSFVSRPHTLAECLSLANTIP